MQELDMGSTRAHPRHPCELRVAYCQDTGDLQASTSLNISAGGLFVQSRAMPESNSLMLEVSLSEGKTAFLWSEVRHAHRAGSTSGFGVSVAAPPSVWLQFCETLDNN